MPASSLTVTERSGIATKSLDATYPTLQINHKSAQNSVRNIGVIALSRCAWAEIYYRHHRDKGQSHADALRRLGQRWLKIIHKMWMDRKPYDAALHHHNQLKHGSWVLQLNAT
jgi:hypothetical protein